MDEQNDTVYGSPATTSESGASAPTKQRLANDGRAKFRVWWVPQIPMRPFLYGVPTYAAAKMLEDVLGKYDLFQFEHNVKPDYSNMGGVNWQHPVLTQGAWHDLDADDAEYYELVGDAKLSSTRGTTD